MLLAAAQAKTTPACRALRFCQKRREKTLRRRRKTGGVGSAGLLALRLRAIGIAPNFPDAEVNAISPAAAGT